MKRNTKQLLIMIFVFTLIAVAYSCRMLAKFDIGGVYMNYIRAALYLLLFALWGFSIDRRIIQTQALHCLRLTAALMLVWLVLRTLKYEVVTGLTAARYIWYLYYLPMLFIPLLGVYIALSLGKTEKFRLTGKIGALAIIPAVLFLFVITNDLHQQVFAFSSGVPGDPDNYSYSHRPLYFICLGWMVACMIFSLVCLFNKSRVPSAGKKELAPFALGCVTILYGLLYLSGAACRALVVWRYECNALSFICGYLRKLYSLPYDTVKYWLCRAFRGNYFGGVYCRPQREYSSPLPCRG